MLQIFYSVRAINKLGLDVGQRGKGEFNFKWKLRQRLHTGPAIDSTGSKRENGRVLVATENPGIL